MTATQRLPTHPVLALAKPLPPPPIPDGWQIGPPDFVGLGAMRAGTTWWFSILRRHRRIVANQATPEGLRPAGAGTAYFASEQAKAYINKEFHYFDHYAEVAEVDPNDYHRYFPRPPGQLAGEWTPRYLSDFWTPPMLAAAAADTKVLVILRDPVERFVSGINRFSSLGFDADAALFSEQFGRGLYWQQLTNVLNWFGREQLLVLQYEQCIRDFEVQVERTFGFLGLDAADWEPPVDPRLPVGLTTGELPDTVSAATRDALRRAYQADLGQLLRDFPELDGQLWPSAAG